MGKTTYGGVVTAGGVDEDKVEAREVRDVDVVFPQDAKGFDVLVAGVCLGDIRGRFWGMRFWGMFRRCLVGRRRDRRGGRVGRGAGGVEGRSGGASGFLYKAGPHEGEGAGGGEGGAVGQGCADRGTDGLPSLGGLVGDFRAKGERAV